MANAIPERKAATVIPPRATATSLVGVAATTTAAASVDVTALASGNPYITVYADGADTAVSFADTQGHAEALNPATTGLIGDSAATCWVIPAGGEKNFLLEKGVDVRMGYRTVSGSGFLRYYASSQTSNG
jgi:hypothetical protein